MDQGDKIQIRYGGPTSDKRVSLAQHTDSIDVDLNKFVSYYQKCNPSNFSAWPGRGHRRIVDRVSAVEAPLSRGILK